MQPFSALSMWGVTVAARSVEWSGQQEANAAFSTFIFLFSWKYWQPEIMKLPIGKIGATVA